MAALFILGVSPAVGQDPLKTLPDAYKVQFENDWVRVVRVHYDAGANLPEHTHPAGTTAYVYLNDSDGVVFRHSSGSSRAVTRPPVKAGSVRIASGSAETHTAENPASTSSDFLRLQFKTESGTERGLRRRIPRGTYAAGENAADVQFSNGQMRLTRLIIATGKSIDVETPAEPALLIALSPARLTVTRGSSTDITLMLGHERWIAPRQREQISNNGTAPIELLRFDFLTAPSTP